MDKGSKKGATFLVSLCDLHQRGRRVLCSHDIQTGTNYCLDHEASASVGPHQMILVGKRHWHCALQATESILALPHGSIL